MTQKGRFFSLKWKIILLFGGVFLCLHSIFSYYLYLQSADGFSHTRNNIQTRYSNISLALTKDSFLVLEQFAELFSVGENSKQASTQVTSQIIATLDANWQRWNFIWGLENVVLYNQQGVLLKNWGQLLTPQPATVLRLLEQESPDHQIICSDLCYQFVMIPVMANSELIAVLGVSRSFANMVIEFNRATDADIGVLVAARQGLNQNWPYKLSAITHGQRNTDLISAVSQRYSFNDFLNQRKLINHYERTYELSIFPIKVGIADQPPFFVIIDDVTEEKKAVNSNFKQVWQYGVISLLLTLALLLALLFLPLRRIIRLAEGLPLLALHRYDDFRQLLQGKVKLTTAYDELDLLNYTAFTLADQLDGLEQQVKAHIVKLISQSQELTKERDFIHQLIDVAPILIITHDNNGMILSINQVGIDEFSEDESSIIGTKFDEFIPENEVKHLDLLNQLRRGQHSKSIKIDGVLMVKPSQLSHISWIHSIISPGSKAEENIILSLGMDVSERKQIEMQMLRMATHDQLTGMNNRRKFQLELAREIALAKRYKTEMALFYLDLDQFKVVNDNCGHEAGDKLLKLVAKTLEQVVRGTDTLSRIGGDEFTLIMPNATEQGIKQVANKINDQLKALEFQVEDNQYKISCSIGIAIHPQHGEDSEELLSNADMAMYHAKESGRGQFHLFSLQRDYHTHLTSRIYWKEVIEDALEQGRFVLCYQPILDLQLNQISHYECLSRIRKADGGLIMPNEYIGFAEDLGLIGQIDRKVLKIAIEQHIKFKKQGQSFKLAVNLSGRSFNDTTIFDNIASELARPEVSPEQIIFEITETAAVSNFSAARLLIKKIKDLGCSLALDDFGVGFSSFKYIKYLPVDYVKIDGSFIKQLDQNYEDKVLVKALTEVSQALGKKTVAEFVENERILTVIREFGIDYAQGYHIGRPDFME